MPKKDTQHRLRIRKFVRTNIEIRPSPEQEPSTDTTGTLKVTELPATAEKPAPILIKQHPDNIPLFMETLFKAKEYDPL